MIDYIRSFIDQISFEALKVNIIIWLSLWIIFKLMSLTKYRENIINFESKYLKDLYLFILFIISFFIVRYQIKIDFIEKFLNINPI